MNLNVVRRRQWWASMGSPSSTDGTTLLYVDALPNCQPGKDDARPCHLAQLSAFRWGSHAHRWPSRVNANKSDRLRWTPQWTTLLRIQPSRSTRRSWSVEHSRWLIARAFGGVGGNSGQAGGVRRHCDECGAADGDEGLVGDGLVMLGRSVGLSPRDKCSLLSRFHGARHQDGGRSTPPFGHHRLGSMPRTTSSYRISACMQVDGPAVLQATAAPLHLCLPMS
jgi:hypothetical protein